jgi:flagellar biosynthetic protein FlhB
VITNPTHYAIALKWDEKGMSAPKVVAKGVDFMAQRIREIAQEHKVPLVENPPLARSLYDVVDFDQEIPPQYYKAVAEVIRFVTQKSRRL